ncbi:hypothetical protein [Vibrio mediterranei]|nr:hypothetical protein [Vibrio mediterranei]
MRRLNYMALIAVALFASSPSTCWVCFARLEGLLDAKIVEVSKWLHIL